MKLSKFLQSTFIVTLLALVYIHMQMQIYALAYEGKQKEKQIVTLTEKKGMLALDILRLKSSRSLGGKLLAEKSDLHFQDNSNVVELVAAYPAIVPGSLAAVSARKPNPILNFLSLKSQAEARTEENVNSPKPWESAR